MHDSTAILTELFCKVETIGDAYMVVSGAPIVSKFHAVYVADMAFDVVSTMARLPDPSRMGEHLKVRIGENCTSSEENTCPNTKIVIVSHKINGINGAHSLSKFSCICVLLPPVWSLKTGPEFVAPTEQNAKTLETLESFA